MSGRTRNATGAKFANLDVEDMERRIVEFRVILDREKRRCRKAQKMHIFEKLLKDKLNEDAGTDQGGADNTIKLDRLDNDGFKRLSNFLKDTIGLCSQFEQHEQFQNVVRDVLQTARRKLVRVAGETGNYEPFCLFCGTNSNERHQDGCSREHHHDPVANGCGQEMAQLAGGQLPIENGRQSSTSPGAGSQTEIPANVNCGHLGMAQFSSAAPHVATTPPPSAAPTPDVVESAATFAQQQQRLDTSIQRLKNQFHRSFVSRGYSPSAPTPNKQTPPSAGMSTTPPLSPNMAARLLLQQQQQAQAALATATAAANSQQVNSTTTTGSSQQPSATYQPQAPAAAAAAASNVSTTESQQQMQTSVIQSGPPPPPANTSTVQVQPSDSDEDSIYGDTHGPDSVRSTLERIDRLDLSPLRAANGRPQRCSTPLSGDEQPSKGLVIDESANLSQEKPMSPIGPLKASKMRIKSSHKALQSNSTMIKVDLPQTSGRSKPRPELNVATVGPAERSSGHAQRAARILAGPPDVARLEFQRSSPLRVTSGSGPTSSSSASTATETAPATRSLANHHATRLAQANSSQSQPSPTSSRIEEAARRAARGGCRTKTTKRKVSSQLKRP